MPATPLVARVQTAAAGALFVALLVLVTGCATPAGGPRDAASDTSPGGTRVEPPPANVNLSGFPLPYRQGYADGCASVGGTERKDASRFAADGNYRTGWQDGVAQCRKK